MIQVDFGKQKGN